MMPSSLAIPTCQRKALRILPVLFLQIKMRKWIESIYYRDRQHMNEVLTKIDKDERSKQMMKQSMDLLAQGAKFIVGDFERLSV
jgi:hypothetical protein